MRMILYFVLLTAGAVSTAQGQNDKLCQMVLDCLQSADKAFQQCQSSSGQNQTKKSSKNDECNFSDLQSQIRTKTSQQKKDYATCISDRIQKKQPYDMTLLMNPKKQQKCQQAIQNFQNPGSNNGPTQDSTDSRNKRQAPDTTNDEGEGDSGAENNGNGGGKQGKGKGGSSAGINGNGGGKGGGKGNGKGKGKGGGHKGNPCLQNAKQIYSRCKALAECCSESQICHLQFELSDLHDQIRRLQKDVAEKKHDCNAKKVQNLSSNSAKSPTLRDSPITNNSGKGENMQVSSEEDTGFNVKSDLDKFSIDEMDDDEDNLKK